MKKLNTIDLKGKAYATVPTRIKEFRETCPNGLIESKPEFLADGQVMFTARILKDKANPSSGESSGHAIGKLTGDKAFEKLETIAVGRALALLGFMASGEIASSEEMEEFNSYQSSKKEDAISLIKKAKKVDELKNTFLSLSGGLMAEQDVIKAKNTKYTELTTVQTKPPKTKKVNVEAGEVDPALIPAMA
jgi:hypothetical protein